MNSISVRKRYDAQVVQERRGLNEPETLGLRGGFPESLLAAADRRPGWRENFVRTTYGV